MARDSLQNATSWITAQGALAQRLRAGGADRKKVRTEPTPREGEAGSSVRRVAQTRLYTRLMAAAGDPPDTNIVLGDYQATSENLPELNGGKPAKIETKKELHFPNLCLILS